MTTHSSGSMKRVPLSETRRPHGLATASAQSRYLNPRFSVPLIPNPYSLT
jgi:hypothetical protein